jgi:hypothetical protein
MAENKNARHLPGSFSLSKRTPRLSNSDARTEELCANAVTSAHIRDETAASVCVGLLG